MKPSTAFAKKRPVFRSRVSEDKRCFFTPDRNFNKSYQELREPCIRQTSKNKDPGDKQWLEDFLGRSVRAFAYPYRDHSRVTAALVAQAGFDLACPNPSDGGVERRQSLQVTTHRN